MAAASHFQGTSITTRTGTATRIASNASRPPNAITPRAMALAVASSFASCFASATSSATSRCASLITDAMSPRELTWGSGVAFSSTWTSTDASSGSTPRVFGIRANVVDYVARQGAVEIGYTLSSEERQPQELVKAAQMAEAIGFPFALISDHFHPWTDAQGSSPFVWGVLGAIAATTRRLRVGTGVTCPIMRMHPAIVAQASATIACMMPGRFFLGVGSGESLKGHITGEAWPPPEMRQDMLEEAVGVLRELHQGGEKSHHGKFFKVHDARIYNLPEKPFPIYLAAAGDEAARLAARVGDGLICSAPSAESVPAFDG